MWEDRGGDESSSRSIDSMAEGHGFDIDAFGGGIDGSGF
jgi:hypothetical protein